MIDSLMEAFVKYPIWQFVRFFGIVSFVMITAGLCVGVFYGVKYRDSKTKLAIYNTHHLLTTGGTALGILHAIITVIDTHTPYPWFALLIPFTAKVHPVLAGIATLAVYMLLIVILTTDLRNKIKRSLWLTLHLLAYPAFVMTLIHGFLRGTDSNEPYMQVIYILSVSAVLLSVMIRSLLSGEKVMKTVKQ